MGGLMGLLLLGPHASGQGLRINGRVIDEATQEPLAYATVAIEGTSIGVVANGEGYFTLAVPEAHRQGALLVSFLGYGQQRYPLLGVADGVTFRLSSRGISTHEISIEARVDTPLIERVVRKIEYNYPQVPTLLTGFYRNRLQLESTDEDLQFSEAVLQMYKAAYQFSYDEDQVRLLKGRKGADRYTVTSRDGKYRAELPHLVAGPQAGSKVDVAALRPPFLNLLTLDQYDYQVVAETVHEERPVYVVTYAPKDSANAEAHSAGTLYIDQATEALVRAEFTTHPRRIELNNRVKSELLTLRQHQTVQYRRLGDTWYLHYVSAETEYRSRTTQQKLLLALEFLVTDIATDDIRPFKRKDILAESDVLTEYIGPVDTAFWESYNVIRN